MKAIPRAEMEFKRRPVVALDVDSVLFAMNELVILPALKRAGFDHVLQEITCFDYADCLGRPQKKVAFDQFKRRDLYDGQPLADGAPDALAMLRSIYRVIAVSSPFAQHATSKWKFIHRAGFRHSDIYLCGDKSLIDFDVLVDDRMETAIKIGSDRIVIFDRPWNRPQGNAQIFERAYDWADVPRKVARLLP